MSVMLQNLTRTVATKLNSSSPYLLPSLLGVARMGVCLPSLEECAVDGRLDELEGLAAVIKRG